MSQEWLDFYNVSQARNGRSRTVDAEVGSLVRSAYAVDETDTSIPTAYVLVASICS